MKLLIAAFIGALLVLPGQSYAHESARVLSFTQWKAQQMVEAENRVIRASNQLQLAKKNVTNIHKINKLDSNLRVAAQGVEFAQELGVEDYFNVYLEAFSDSDAALVAAASMMTEVEMAQLLKALLKTKSYMLSSEANIGSNSAFVSAGSHKPAIAAQL